MYIDRQIRSLVEAAKVTGTEQWINIKQTREKINEYISSKQEFTVDELVSMVQLMDSEVMAQDRMVKDLRFELYFNPEKRDEIFNKMEKMFKNHVYVKIRKSTNDKFVIEEASKM